MIQARARSWLSVSLAVALGACLRLAFIHYAPTISGDTFIYGDIALSWKQYGIYGFSQPPLPPTPTLIRLPGYPLFLVLCFHLFGAEHYTAVLLVQLVVDLAAALLLAALARRLFGPRAGVLALFLAALCPFTASYVAAALTETLTLATITVAFYALARWAPPTATTTILWTPWNRWLWILSATLAAALLLRPEQGLLAAAVLPAVLWISWISATHPPTSASTRRRSALAPALAASLCVLLPLLPWTIRNARTFHVFQPLAPRSAVDPGEPTPAGFDLWFRTWGIDFASTEDLYWNYDGARLPFSEIPPRAFDTPAQAAQTAALIRDYNLTARPSPELEARFHRLATDRIRAHPIRYWVALPLARLANMLLRPRIEMLPIPLAWWRAAEHPAQTAFALAYATLNLAWLLAGVLGFARWTRRQPDPTRVIAWSMIAFLLLRSALLLTLDNSEPRYTLELFPILTLGIAALSRRDTTQTRESSPRKEPPKLPSRATKPGSRLVRVKGNSV